MDALDGSDLLLRNIKSASARCGERRVPWVSRDAVKRRRMAGLDLVTATVITTMDGLRRLLVNDQRSASSCAES